MIIYNDWGKHLRLGNWLFIYAGLQSIIKDSNNKIAFPNYFLWSYLKKIPTITTDNRFNEIFYFRTNVYSEEEKLFLKEYFIKNSHKQININLGSNLQSEKWFKEDIDYIKNCLAIRESKIQIVRDKYIQFFTKPTIGVGIRRGDFINHDVFYQIPETWYKKALDNNFDYNQYNVVIFSDDINWCKKYYKNENFLYAEDNNTATHADNFKHYHNNPMDQFILASLMDNFVGSNSTFSWWNMWYVKNFNSGKVIHCGKNLSEKGQEQFGINENYYPENWIKFT